MDVGKIIDDLLFEKEKLEQERDKNLEEIKLYDKIIAYFMDLYMRNHFLAVRIRRQIDSYMRLEDFSDSGIIRTSFLKRYMQGRRTELENKEEKFLASQKEASGLITDYSKKRKKLDDRNQEIDIEIIRIDNDLNRLSNDFEEENYHAKVKKIERRNIND